MDPNSTQDASTEILKDKFRIEDYAIQLLIAKLQNHSVQPEYIGHIAHKVLEVVSQAYTRAEMVDLISHAETEYPELHLLSERESVYVKEQAESIIKQTIEELVQQKQIDSALNLAKTISSGGLPQEIQDRIQNI